jgi:hypothetical protein
MEFESDAFFTHDLRRCLDWSAKNLESIPTVYAFPNGSSRESQRQHCFSEGIKDVLLVGDGVSRADARVHLRVAVLGSTSHEGRIRIARAV